MSRSMVCLQLSAERFKAVMDANFYRVTVFRRTS